MTDHDFLVRDLPSPESAERFLLQFGEKNPSHLARLRKNDGLLSDVLALASNSPLLATTLIQNPEYIGWLGRKRSASAVRDKEELLESLARFAMTNSSLEPNVMFARFRRRELLRIFLRDVRRLGTIAEITEEISNLADAILENALRIARQMVDNRNGPPFESDAKGRERASGLAVVSLGKLGSKELNYSSDVDLLFIYSADGKTKGTGERPAVTNTEYFVKVAETVTRLVGNQSGEGAAYRIDLRLRPRGRVGALALSLKETTRYYLNEARNWERQVLIRSRCSAGNTEIFRKFYALVESAVYARDLDPAAALEEVYRSKKKIDEESGSGAYFNVKLGRGGIREIEFIAQALQLAFGGRDRWLRAPHTLISLARLTDRGYLTESEHTELAKAYDLLRRLEHLLQMEHGLQTHTLPSEPEKLELLARKAGFADAESLRNEVEAAADAVNHVFLRVFGEDAARVRFGGFGPGVAEPDATHIELSAPPSPAETLSARIISAIEKYGAADGISDERRAMIERIAAVSPAFSEMLAAMPWLAEHLAKPDAGLEQTDYRPRFEGLAAGDVEMNSVMSPMRRVWARSILEIAAADIYRTLPVAVIRSLQTRLAEASVDFALRAAMAGHRRRSGIEMLPPAVFGLGKLGSGTLDYGSDLDMVIVFDEEQEGGSAGELAEHYGRMIETFVTLLSSMTREGNLYRVDLRLRPYGKEGPTAVSRGSLIDYILEHASIWELLAYVQLRAVTDGDAADFEAAIREAIRQRAAAEPPEKIREDCRTMRLRLEELHGTPKSGRDVNLKFGAGGLLDVYFIVRYLQLLWPDAVGAEDRSTGAKLKAFLKDGTIETGDFEVLSGGHSFLSELDHNVRLTVGRTSRYPRTNRHALAVIAERMGLPSPEDLLNQLTIHRHDIRAVFEGVFTPSNAANDP
ncbi:MAG: hypothetical protein IPM25_00945 [Chloracidobacterium sp.]|nr:hypothetical protein [Chloracidobacterium sp.]